MKYLIAIIIILFLILVYVIAVIFCFAWSLRFLKYGDLYYYTTIEPDVTDNDSTRFFGEYYKFVNHPHSIATHFRSITESL